MDIKKSVFQRANIEDFPIILDFLKEAALWLKQKGINYWQDWINPPDNFKCWIYDGVDNNQFWLVLNKAETIGVFRLMYQDKLFWGERNDETGYIHSLTTSRKHSGLGLGYYILRWIEEYCHIHGKDFLRLDCGEHLDRLVKYYREFGFNTFSNVVVNGEHLVLLEKRIRNVV